MKKIIFFLTAISLFTFHGCQKDPGTIDNRIAITDKVITSGGSADISGTISCPIENININNPYTITLILKSIYIFFFLIGFISSIFFFFLNLSFLSAIRAPP